MPMFGRKITPMLGKGKHGFKINYILLLFITHHYLLRTYIPPKDHAKCLRGNEKHTSSWLPRICRILELIMMAIILFAHNFTDYKGLWDLNSGLFGYFFFLGNWELKQPGGLWPHTHPNKTRDQGHARRQRYHGETQQGNISYKAHLGSPKCRQHGEPRRTGSLGWKSNQGRHHGQEKQWRKDMHRWRCPDRPQRIGDQRPGAWALIWNGFMSGRWLSQATSTSLAILAHLWIFQMCLPFLPLCLSSIGCFLKHPPPVPTQHCQKQLLFKNLLPSHHHLYQGDQNMACNAIPKLSSPAFPAPLLPLPLAFAILPTYSTSLPWLTQAKAITLCLCSLTLCFMPSLVCYKVVYISVPQVVGSL